MYFQPECDYQYKSDYAQSSVSNYMSAVYPTSYPVAAAGYPGVYCDFGLYPYPVACRRGYDEAGYYAYDRRYTAAAAEATQRLRSYYGGGGATPRSAYELSPSPPPSPGVATRIASSCRLVTSSESATAAPDKMASYGREDPCRGDTSIAEVTARNRASAAGYSAAAAGNGQFFAASHAPARGHSSPRTSPSSSESESDPGLQRSASAAVSSSPAGAADCAPVNLAGRWTGRRTVIMGDGETTTGVGHHHHQSVIRRTRHDAYDPTPTVADSLTTAPAAALYDATRESTVDEAWRPTTVTSTIHDSKVYDYHIRLKAAAAATAPGTYPSFYCPSQPDHSTAVGGSSPTDVDDVEGDYAVALRQQLTSSTTDARPYFRVGCAAVGQHQQRLLQHHVTTGNHVTGYTSVIVDTQQLHANGYVH